MLIFTTESNKQAFDQTIYAWLLHVFFSHLFNIGVVANYRLIIEFILALSIIN